MSHSHLPRRLPLQDLALAPASLAAYNRQLSNFLTYSRLSSSQLLSLPALRLDRLMSEFIQHSFDSALPFTYAAHALHALVFYRPDLRLHLHHSRQCLKGWERSKPSRSHPPLTFELTVLIACSMARGGHHAAALAMLVGFDCYLRVSELTGLRRCDIVLPHDARMGAVHTGMAVCLPKTKTGRNQSVSLQHPGVAQLLCSWVRSLPAAVLPAHRIFPFSPAWFGRLLRNVCVALGLGHIPYVPHSLRHGGATADFLRLGAVEHVHFRGRWKSIESVRTYIQTARALLAAQDVPRRLNRLGLLLSADVVTVFSECRRTVPEVTQPQRARRVTFQL